jgi:oxygen-independent coproporphyrinogen III oxidase
MVEFVSGPQESGDSVRRAGWGSRADGTGDGLRPVPEPPAWPHEESSEAGLYVHIPLCRSKCRYCGFYSVPATTCDPGRLAGALRRELDRYDGVKFCTAYIGGGSPTALPAEQLIGLARWVARQLPSEAEFTVECNPGQVERGLLDQLWQAGVNRLSFGAQSFRAAELELLGRGHTVEDIGRSVDLAKRAGFDNLSLDLIFAIPGSTLAHWQYSVEAALESGVPHISAYSLSFEPGTVFDAWRKGGRLTPVEEELDRTMYEWAVERLGRAGIEQYEISNFARLGYQCRHNLGYWANRPFVGLGPGAASSTGILPVSSMGVPPMNHRQDADATESHGPDGRATHGRPAYESQEYTRARCPWYSRPGRPCYSWAGRPCYGQSCRVTNDPDIERYVAAIDNGNEVPGEVQPVSEEDAICETAVLNLRRRAGIDLVAFRHRTGCDAIRTFAGPIRRYRGLGLIEVTGRSVRLTKQALPIADSILCDFAGLE